MPTALPQETFLALACVVHADGRLKKEEVSGLMRAAEAYGVSSEEIQELLARASSGLALSEVTWPPMSTWQRALTYAFAAWVARSDGSVSREEHSLLAELSDALGLEKLRRDAARSAMYDIAALPGGNRPERFDFAALEERLSAKLPGSFRDHDEG